MTTFPVDNSPSSVQGLACAKLQCMWGAVSTIAIVVVGCHSESHPEQSREIIRGSDSAVVAAEKRETSRFVSLRLWKTEEFLDRVAIGMPILDIFSMKNGDQNEDLSAGPTGLVMFSSPYQISFKTETIDSEGSKVEEELVLFFCRTNEMPPDALISPDELKLTAVAKRIPSESVADEPVLVYIMPEALKGKKYTGCPLIDMK